MIMHVSTCCLKCIRPMRLASVFSAPSNTVESTLGRKAISSSASK